MSRKRPLGEEVVVIGGGSYGLGRAIAVATARRGATVVVGARTREALDGTLAEIEAAGGKGLAAETGDLVLLRTGWTSEHTEGPKPTDSPDNLFEPLPGDPGAHGRFDERSSSTTAWTWLRLNRALIGAGLGLGTMGLLAGLGGRFSPRDGMLEKLRPSQAEDWHCTKEKWHFLS